MTSILIKREPGSPDDPEYVLTEKLLEVVDGYTNDVIISAMATFAAHYVEAIASHYEIPRDEVMATFMTAVHACLEHHDSNTRTQ